MANLKDYFKPKKKECIASDKNINNTTCHTYDMLPFRWTVEIIKLFNWRGVLSCLEEYYQK